MEKLNKLKKGKKDLLAYFSISPSSASVYEYIFQELRLKDKEGTPT